LKIKIKRISGESCSPINNTKPKQNKAGLKYVAPNTCPEDKTCQNKCKKGCIDDNKTCKDILQTYDKNTNDLNNIRQLADDNAIKDYANKYKDKSICKSQKNYKKLMVKHLLKSVLIMHVVITIYVMLNQIKN